jgi:hypothetical protein
MEKKCVTEEMKVMRLASFGMRKIWTSTVPELAGGMSCSGQVGHHGLDKQRSKRLLEVCTWTKP